LNAAKEIVAFFAFTSLITPAAAAGEYQTNPNLNYGKSTKTEHTIFSADWLEGAGRFNSDEQVAKWKRVLPDCYEMSM